MVTVNPTLDFLKLLAHDVRWAVVAALAESDRRVQELVELLQRPQNLVSYHLRLLRQGHLVNERRSSADGRDVYYSLDLDYLRALYQESGQALHPALACAQPVAGASQPQKEKDGGIEAQRPFRILFLCTHNSARSQLAEGILRAAAGDWVEVFSAGNEPSFVHPLAIRAASIQQIDISNQRSKHMAEFAGQTFDYVITVCDRVRESCPVFPDDPHQIHWSFPDPAAVTGSDEQQFQAFLQTARELSTRIGYLRLMMERRQQEL
ncbi:MAG: metalloregulator ArsR/SmtB family transcription factor [Anaerolineae bacterium]|nr:metalloregulator ArsR/SmtB family transcription factor [Anaerolineae bacterium]